MFAFKLVNIGNESVTIRKDPLDDDDKDRVLSSEQYQKLKALMPGVIWFEIHPPMTMDD